MNRTDAFKKLKRILGKDFRYREDPRALVGEEREQAILAWRKALGASQAAEEAMKAKREELLRDPEYLRLKAENLAAYEATKQTGSVTLARRVTVGTISGHGMFFSIIAQGDNWQEVVDKLTAKPQ